MEKLAIRAVCGGDYPAVLSLYAYVHAIREENRPDLFNALKEPLTAAMFEQICRASNRRVQARSRREPALGERFLRRHTGWLPPGARLRWS